MKNNTTNPEEISVHTILTDIKSGKLDPVTLAKPVRQQCVEALMLEGHQPSALAPILKVSDKTIKRDLNEIFERNAVNPSPELAKRLIGEFLQKMHTHHAYLMRLARSKEGSLREKGEVEYLAWRTQKEAIELLQSLGYLPSRPTQIVGDIFHHADRAEPAIVDIKKQIAEIELIAEETKVLTPEVLAKLGDLKLRTEKAEIQEEVQKVSDKAKPVEEQDDLF